MYIFFLKIPFSNTEQNKKITYKRLSNKNGHHTKTICELDTCMSGRSTVCTYVCLSENYVYGF